MKKGLLLLVLGMSVLGADEWTDVERSFVNESPHPGTYSSEKIKVLEVSDSRELGKLVAYRFLEWAKANPAGVIALPTGKTPEAFINYMSYLKTNWNQEQVQQELAAYGLSGPMPDLKALKFVQIDEFYALDSKHAGSYIRYVKEHYLNLFGTKQALLMDINNKGVLGKNGTEGVFPHGKIEQNTTLQMQALQEAEAFAKNYEQQIRAWGGIGFFLGGLGVDGHVAFNLPGTSFQSRTRLAKLGYVPAAQAAISLGGMEFARDRQVMTIGLNTILMNPDATVIVMVAGEGKAPAVRRAVEGAVTPDAPASVFQRHPHARFYVTKGAAKELTDRKVEDVQLGAITKPLIDDILLSIALEKKKSLNQLSASDIKNNLRGQALVNRLKKTPAELKTEVLERLGSKFEYAVPEGKRVLHTGPHHDDVLLSYFGFLPRLLGHNGNLFVYLTSGFNAVKDSYIKERLEVIANEEIDPFEALETPYAVVLARMIRAARAQNETELKHYEAILLLRHMGIVYNDKELPQIKKRARSLLTDYFAKKAPGEKDTQQVQLLKGAMRESEEDRHMTMQGVPVRDVIHMRSHFYTGDYFNPLPTIEKDAKPFLQIYESFKPHVVTVALDPEGTGPDTHYKVLQVVSQAANMSSLEPKIWGYRNVWHAFSIAEADIIIPVSQKQLDELHECFMNCYTTQKQASFPAIEYDGPFSEYAVIKQQEQLAAVKRLMGDAFFTDNKNEAIRNAAGLLFLKELSKQELATYAREL